LLLYQGGKNK